MAISPLPASADPSWWTNVLNTSSAADHAPVVLGQLKWMATNAADELEAGLPGRAGTGVWSLVNGFDQASNWHTVNLGQLKYVAAPFYSRLLATQYTNSFPWTTNTVADDADWALINIGQLKNVFNFSVSTDADSDSLPDWWEIHCFGSVTNQNGTNDFDGDGLNNAEEFALGASPASTDSDGDEMPDGWEFTHGLDPLVDDAALDADNDGLTNLQECQHGSDPGNSDTDGDGMSDGQEVTGRTMIIAWGGGWNGECESPWWITNAVAVSAGNFHSMALLADGTILSWGNNFYGQCDVPADVTNAIAISAGGGHNSGMSCDTNGGHSMALLEDGTVRCWGWNGESECNIPADVSTGVVTAIAAGGFHSVALLSNGTVRVWGDNSCTQISSMPTNLSYVVSIAAGDSFTMALTSDSNVVCWGINDSGQTNTPLDLATDGIVSAIAAGAHTAVALLNDGTVRCWGRGDSGQTNVPSNVTNAVAIAAAELHTMALLADGTLVTWGTNDECQCNVPDIATNVLAIAACGVHNVAIIHVSTSPLTPDVNHDGMPADLWSYTTNFNSAYPYTTNQNIVLDDPDASNPDSDGDGLSNALETSIGSDPGNAFTSGMSQGWLWKNFGTLSVDPNADADGDGLTNLQEYLLGTDPNVKNQSDPLGLVKLRVFTPLEP